MPKQTHTHTLHTALVGYLIVFSFVTKCGQTIEFPLWGTIVPLNFLVGYHCSIVASTPHSIPVHTHTDKLDPSNRARVYWIPCECDKVYIGETGRNLPTRLKEHRAHGRRGDFEKSSIVKHSHIKDHQIDWHAAQLITPINSWHTRRIREAIDIFKHDTVPQDIGFFISDIWRPLLRTHGSSISKVNPPPPLCLSTTDSVQ